jgi:hypothetical protein
VQELGAAELRALLGRGSARARTPKRRKLRTEAKGAEVEGGEGAAVATEAVASQQLGAVAPAGAGLELHVVAPVGVELGRIIALCYRHPLYTTFAYIFGTFFSEATMRPNLGGRLG